MFGLPKAIHNTNIFCARFDSGYHPICRFTKIDIPLNYFWTREVKILTSYFCGPPDILEAIQLLQKGTIIVDDLIPHKLPLDDIVKGYQLVVEGKESINVIITPAKSAVSRTH
ncbi:MAG: hypothetical protein ACQ9MH_18990 [Nitrospinales bacterium]